MSFFKMGVQAIREKTGADRAEIDPKYEDAASRFDLIQERVHSLLNDCTNLIKTIGPIVNIGKDFAESAMTNALFAKNSQSRPAKQLVKMFTDLHQCLNSEFIKEETQNAVQNITNINEKLDSIEKFKEKRRKAQLLYNSAKFDLEQSLHKGNEAKTQKLAKTYMKKKEEMEEVTQQFITQVEFIWEHQFEIIEEPLNNLVRLSFMIITQCLNTNG